MFLYDKFCHCASNERWEKQSALFLYETIDTLQQMTTAATNVVIHWVAFGLKASS